MLHNRRDLTFFFHLFLIFFCFSIITGCSGGENNDGSSFTGRAGLGGDAASLLINCPFDDSNPSARAILSTIEYYVVNVYEKDTMALLSPEQRVYKPSSGGMGAAIFRDLPAGNVIMVAQGYTGDDLLACENWQELTIEGGASPVVATVIPTAGPAPAGFVMQRIEPVAGSSSISISDFGSSREALLLVTYNSQNPDPGMNFNEIETGGTVNNTYESAPLSGTGIMKRARLQLQDEQMPLRDIEHITRLTIDAIKRFGIPKPVTRERLIELGRMDRKGNFTCDTVGQTRNFYIWYQGGYVNPLFTCRYAGSRAVIYVDNDDWNVNIAQERVDSIGQFFDEVVWQKAEELFGPISELRWGDRVYIIFTTKEAHGAIFSPEHEYDSSEVPYSNQLDSIYCDPTLGRPGIKTTDRDWQGIVAHEFQHLVRWYRKIYQSGHTHYDEDLLIHCIYYDGAVNEGLSQYFEIMVGRGLLYGDDLSRYVRVKNIRQYLQKPNICPFTGGNDVYATGFLMTFYIFDHYGMEALRRLELPNGRLGLDSLEDGTEETTALLFTKYAMAIRLAPLTGMNAPYTFTSIDLSGKTTYYGEQGFFPAWNYHSNINDFALGVDLAESQYQYSLAGSKTYEWAAQFQRFFNGSGNRLAIDLTGYAPPPAGGGDFSIYLLSR